MNLNNVHDQVIKQNKQLQDNNGYLEEILGRLNSNFNRKHPSDPSEKESTLQSNGKILDINTYIGMNGNLLAYNSRLINDLNITLFEYDVDNDADNDDEKPMLLKG